MIQALLAIGFAALSAWSQPCTGPPLILSSLPQGPECSAARRILAMQPSPPRATAAQNFIRRFPKSRFLHWAYDILARSVSPPFLRLKIARKSLALRPENPSLHILAAEACHSIRNVRCEVQHLAEALFHSEDLATSEATPSIDSLDTEAFHPKLLGRLVALLRSHSYSKRWPVPVVAMLETRVVQWLLRQLENNPAGTVDGYLNAAASESPNVLAPLMLAIESLDAETRVEANAAIVRTLRPAARRESLATATTSLRKTLAPLLGPSQNLTKAVYAGSRSCITACHVEIGKQWASSGMGSVLSTVSAALTNGRISNRLTLQPLRVGKRSLARARLNLNPPSFYIDLFQGGRWVPYPVSHVVGGISESVFLTPGRDGAIYVLPPVFKVREGSWFLYGELAIQEQKAVIEHFSPVSSPQSSFGHAFNYRLECIHCHTTGYRWDAEDFDGSFDEPHVGCESCHGPSKLHSDWRSSNPSVLGPDPRDPKVYLSSSQASPNEFNSVCGPCHSHSRYWNNTGPAKNQTGYSWPFMPAPPRLSLDRFAAKAFSEDGRLRLSGYIWESVRRTKCHLMGGASCGSCHKIHSGVSANDANKPGFIRPDRTGNRMCTSCHRAHKVSPETTRPSETRQLTSRCIDCHMPPVTRGLAETTVRNHQFDWIPQRPPKKPE